MQSSQLQLKRSQIRNSRRKCELQTIFANKRRLLLQVYSQEKQSTNILAIIQQLNNSQQIDANVINLANILSKEHPFQHLPNSTQETIADLCVHINTLILQRVIINYKTQSKEDVTGRVNCLNVIINLLADKHCPNRLLTQHICAFLRNTYYSVQIWGVDKEMVEVGWMIGNLLGKQEFAYSDDQDVEYIMEWSEQLCLMKDAHMLYLLYNGLKRFIPSLQDKYELPHSQLPQQFKTRVINILTVSVQTHLNQDHPPNTLISVVSLIGQSFILLAGFCPVSLVQLAICKSLPLLGFLSKRLVRQVCKLLSKAVANLSILQMGELQQRSKRIEQVKQHIRVKLCTNYVVKLLSLVCTKQVDMKVQILTVLLYLFQSNSRNTLYFVSQFIKMGLEDVMINTIDIQHQQLIIVCCQIAQTIQRITDGRECQHFQAKAEELEHVVRLFSEGNGGDNSL